ncbi:MAG: hypothetical protein O2967_20870 [Proteobacteria bacterium]|nr:hypothetical protein [Pseudomonadota bacterium]
MEIIRLRCRRAADLGLTYRQYTSVLLDRGVHPRAIFFDLGGTLVQMKNEKIHVDQFGRIQLLPGVLDKFARLKGCDVFVISNDEQACLTIGQIKELSGGIVTDHGVYGEAAEAQSAIVELLAAFKIPPAAAIMVGAAIASENCAHAAKLAKFILAGEYFAMS